MSAVRSSAVVLLCLLPLGGLAAADPQADPREELETAVPEGIRLLEARDYATFLKNFVPPDDLKQFLGTESLDEFAREFGEDRAPRLLQALKAIKDTKPTLDSDGKAVYAFKKSIDGRKSITWVKLGRHWYIQN